RPLVMPYPYTIPGGSQDRQTIALTFAGTPPRRAASGERPVALRLDPAAGGAMPALGLFLTSERTREALAAAPLAKRAAPRFLSCRVDPGKGQGTAELTAYRQVAEAIGAPLMLEIVVPCRDDPRAELERVAAQVAESGLRPAALTVAPDNAKLRVVPAPPPPDTLLLEKVYRAARAVFPGQTIGGGVFGHFTELSRNRPPGELIDYVSHSTSGLVHAADDRSVMETIEALPHVIRSTRAFAGDKPYRIGPANIGMPINPCGAATPNPDNGRFTMAKMDPRQRGLFGAAWMVGYMAEMARGGVAAVAMGAPAGEVGIVYRRCDYAQPFYDERGDGAVYPLFHVFAGLAAAGGRPCIEAISAEPTRGQALAYRAEEGAPSLWLANLRQEPQTVDLAGLGDRPARLWLLDADSFERATTDPAFLDGAGEAQRRSSVTLAAYAVARLQVA